MDKTTKNDYWEGKRIYKCQHCEDQGFVYNHTDKEGREFYRMCACHPQRRGVPHG